MAKIRAALRAVAEKLVSDQTLLDRARKRYKAQHKIAVENHRRQVKFQESADLASGKKAGGYPNAANAERFTKAAARCAHRAYKAHLRAQFWLGRIKPLVQKIEGLEVDHGKIEAEIRKYKREHGVQIRGNKVTGGTARQRLRAALLRAMLNYQQGKQPGYYSQTGLTRVYSHMLEKMPFGHIFDCSTFADGIYFVCGLKDPSDTNYVEGWTGTEGEHGKRVSEADAQVGDLVLYGASPHHHVEVVLDPARKTTVGHGSPPIDEGVFDLFGDSDYEIRSYL